MDLLFQPSQLEKFGIKDIVLKIGSACSGYRTPDFEMKSICYPSFLQFSTTHPFNKQVVFEIIIIIIIIIF
jgi:hypothetical protein